MVRVAGQLFPWGKAFRYASIDPDLHKKKPAENQISFAGFLAQDMHFAIYKEVGPPRQGRLSGDLPRRPADSLDQFRRAYPKECPLPDGVSYYAAGKENGKTFREEIICYIRT